jgi:MoxR-like ATPase
VLQAIIGLLARGNVLIEGQPGLGKTLLVKVMSEALQLQFSRIQFTPDLMPADITGSQTLAHDEQGKAKLEFRHGPVFANIVLADEINRAPPRTQAALLEAMQEHRVTAAGDTMRLPEPFFVLATQNPIEQEGTYPLPEAQLDRFLFDIRIGYPNEEEEVGILRSTTGGSEVALSPVLDAAQTTALQRLTRELPAADPILRYAAALARATRPPSDDRPTNGTSAPPPELVKRYVRWGAGPRAGQALVLGAKAHALLSGRAAVSPDDVRRVAQPVLRHRVLPNFAADADGMTAEQIVAAVVRHVPVPESGIRL